LRGHDVVRETAVKGVILAGGTGSRLYPLTRITNKHLLPIYDRPMIAWAIEAVVSAGIDEIMLVSGGTHAGEFLRLLGNGREYGIKEKAGGIAEALGLAAHFAGGEPVLVMLADNVLELSIKATVDAFCADPSGARILLSKVDEPEHLRHLGVPVFGDDGRVTRIEEKPEKPASDYCVTGIYCYEPGVFEVVAHLEPSARGELEITDVNNHYVGLCQMAHDIQEGFWGDAGESIDAYYAVNDFVRENGANKA
jgi:glucose-1-phosphate thymidylyltransferase